jgi:hypothetical protein
VNACPGSGVIWILWLVLAVLVGAVVGGAIAKNRSAGFGGVERVAALPQRSGFELEISINVKTSAAICRTDLRLASFRSYRRAPRGDNIRWAESRVRHKPQSKVRCTQYSMSAAIHPGDALNDGDIWLQIRLEVVPRPEQHCRQVLVFLVRDLFHRA